MYLWFLWWFICLIFIIKCWDIFCTQSFRVAILLTSRLYVVSMCQTFRVARNTKPWNPLSHHDLSGHKYTSLSYLCVHFCVMYTTHSEVLSLGPKHVWCTYRQTTWAVCAVWLYSLPPRHECMSVYVGEQEETPPPPPLSLTPTFTSLLSLSISFSLSHIHLYLLSLIHSLSHTL